VTSPAPSSTYGSPAPSLVISPTPMPHPSPAPYPSPSVSSVASTPSSRTSTSGKRASKGFVFICTDFPLKNQWREERKRRRKRRRRRGKKSKEKRSTCRAFAYLASFFSSSDSVARPLDDPVKEDKDSFNLNNSLSLNPATRSLLLRASFYQNSIYNIGGFPHMHIRSTLCRCMFLGIL